MEVRSTEQCSGGLETSPSILCQEEKRQLCLYRVPCTMGGLCGAPDHAIAPQISLPCA